MRISYSFFIVAASTLALLGSIHAQDADGPEVKRHLDAARELAGEQWRTTAEFLCGPDPQPGNAAESPIMEPARIFDNLYAFGLSHAVVYALTTEEGLILIDAGYPDQVESVLLPGLEQLGLDPADIRYVIVAHGHLDHYGGAGYLQAEYGASVILSDSDWAMLDQQRAEWPEGAANPPAVRDIVAVEAEPIVLGDTAVTPVLIPGHTPGALGLIFSVRDGDNEHVAGLFGGTILISSRISDEGLEQYIASLGHFAVFAERMGVDVEIQNHPVMDDTHGKLERLAGRSGGAPHPFVVGTDAYQDFLGVIAECTASELARRR